MNNKITATRILEFDAGHRVHQHESKCATLHGHRYKAEIHARAKSLDSVGRVIDFSVLKAKVGSWIDEFWDHTTLVFDQDKETLEALKKMPRFKEPFVCPFNPTAENMAEYLLKEVCPEVLRGSNVEVHKIRLWETPNCFADVEL
jgi:6-pyruvoyltetrahydropterin/6-carboxytetrahydropterin synthase